MSVFIISYDLNKQKNYPALYEAIKAIGSWCHPVDSTWLVSTNSTAAAVRDRVLKVIDSDDALLVSRVAPGDSAWYGMKPDVSAWLRENM